MTCSETIGFNLCGFLIFFSWIVFTLLLCMAGIFVAPLIARYSDWVYERFGPNRKKVEKLYPTEVLPAVVRKEKP